MYGLINALYRETAVEVLLLFLCLVLGFARYWKRIFSIRRKLIERHNFVFIVCLAKWIVKQRHAEFKGW